MTRSVVSDKDVSPARENGEQFLSMMDRTLKRQFVRAISLIVRKKVDPPVLEEYIRARGLITDPSDSSSKNPDPGSSKLEETSANRQYLQSTRLKGKKYDSQKQGTQSNSRNSSLWLSKNLINVEDEENKSDEGQQELQKHEILSSTKNEQRRKWFNNSPDRVLNNSGNDGHGSFKLLGHVKPGGRIIQTGTKERSDSIEVQDLVSQTRHYLTKHSSDQKLQKYESTSIRASIESGKDESGTDMKFSHSSVTLPVRRNRRKLSTSDEEERIASRKCTTAAKTKILVKANKARLAVIRQAFCVLKHEWITYRKVNPALHKLTELMYPKTDEGLEQSEPGDGEEEQTSFIDNISESSQSERSRSPKGQITRGSSTGVTVKPNPYNFHEIVEEQQNSLHTLPSNRKSGSRDRQTPVRVQTLQVEEGSPGIGPKEFKLSSDCLESKREHKPNKSLKPSLSMEEQGLKVLEDEINCQTAARRESHRMLDKIDDVSSEELDQMPAVSKEQSIHHRIHNRESLEGPEKLSISHIAKARRMMVKSNASHEIIREEKRDCRQYEEQLFESFILSHRDSFDYGGAPGTKDLFSKRLTDDKLAHTTTLSEKDSKHSLSNVRSEGTNKTLSDNSYLKVICGLTEINTITKVGLGVGISSGALRRPNSDQQQQYLMYVIHNLFARSNRKSLRQAFSALQGEISSKGEILPLQVRSSGKKNRLAQLSMSPSRKSSVYTQSLNNSCYGVESQYSSMKSFNWITEIGVDPSNVKYMVKCIALQVYYQKRATFKYLKKVMARSQRLQKSLFTLKDVMAKACKMRLNAAFNLIHNKSRGAEWELQMRQAQIERLRILVQKVLNPKLDDMAMGFIKIQRQSQSQLLTITDGKKRTAEYRFLLKILLGIQHSHIRYSIFQLKSWADYVGSMKQIGKHHQLKTMVEQTQRRVTDLLASQKRAARQEIKIINCQLGVRSLLFIIVRQLARKIKAAMVTLQGSVLREVNDKETQIEDSLLKDAALVRDSGFSLMISSMHKALLSKTRLCLNQLFRHSATSRLIDNTKLNLQRSIGMVDSRLRANLKYSAHLCFAKMKKILASKRNAEKFLRLVTGSQRSKVKETFDTLKNVLTAGKANEYKKATLPKMLARAQRSKLQHSVSLLIAHSLTTQARAQTSATSKVVSGLEAQLSSLLSSNSELEAARFALAQTCQDLEKSNEALGHSLLLIERTKTDLELQNVALKQLAIAYNEKIVELEAVNCDRDRELVLLRTRFKEISKEKDEVQRTCIELDEAGNRFKRAIGELEARIGQLDQACLEQKQSIVELEKNKTELTEASLNLNHNLDELQKSKHAVETSIVEMQKNNSIRLLVTTLISQSNMRVKSVFRKLENHANECAFKQFSETSEKTLERMSSEKNMHVARIEVLVTQASSLKQEIDEANLEKERVKAEATFIKQQFDSGIAERDGLIQYQRREIEELTGTNSSLQTQVDELKSQYARLSLLQEADQAAIVSERACLQQQIAALAAEKSDLEARASRLEADYKVLLTSLERKESSLADEKVALSEAQVTFERNLENLAIDQAALLASQSKLTASLNALDQREADLRAGEAQLEIERLEIAKSQEAIEKDLAAKTNVVKFRESDVQAREDRVQAKETEVNKREDQAQRRETYIQAIEREVIARKEQVQAKEVEIQANKIEILTKEAEVQAKANEIQAKEAEILAKDTEVQAKANEVRAKESQIHAKEAEVMAKETEVQAKETKFIDREGRTQSRETHIHAMESEVMAREEKVQAKESEVQAKDARLQAKEEQVKSKEAHIQAMETEVKAKEEQVKAKDAEVQVKEALLHSKEADIQARESKVGSEEWKLLEEKAKFEDYRRVATREMEAQRLEIALNKKELTEERARLETLKTQLEEEAQKNFNQFREQKSVIDKQKEFLQADLDTLHLAQADIEIQKNKIQEVAKTSELEVSRQKEILAKAQLDLEREKANLDQAFKESEAKLIQQKAAIETKEAQLKEAQRALEVQRQLVLEDTIRKEREFAEMKASLEDEKSKLNAQNQEMLEAVNQAKTKMVRQQEALEIEKVGLDSTKASLEAEKAKLMEEIESREQQMVVQKESLKGEYSALQLAKESFAEEKTRALKLVDQQKAELTRQSELLAEKKTSFELEKDNFMTAIKRDQLEVSQKLQSLEQQSSRLDEVRVRLKTERTELLASIAKTELEVTQEKELLGKKMVELDALRETLQSDEIKRHESMKESEKQLAAQRQELDEQKAEFESRRIEILAEIEQIKIESAKYQALLQLEKLKMEDAQQALAADKAKMMLDQKESEAAIASQIEELQQERVKLLLEREELYKSNEQRIAQLAKEKEILTFERSEFESKMADSLAEIKEKELDLTKLVEKLNQDRQEFEAKQEKALASVASREQQLLSERRRLDEEWHSLHEVRESIDAERLEMTAANAERDRQIAAARDNINCDARLLEVAKQEVAVQRQATVDERRLVDQLRRELEEERLLVAEQRRSFEEDAALKTQEIERQAVIIGEARRRLEDETAVVHAATEKMEAEVAVKRQALLEEKSEFDKEKTRLLSSIEESELEIQRQKVALVQDKDQLESEKANILEIQNQMKVEFSERTDYLQQELAKLESLKQSLESEFAHRMDIIKAKEQEVASESEALKAQRSNFESEKAIEVKMIQETQLNLSQQALALEDQRAKLDSQKSKFMDKIKQKEEELDEQRTAVHDEQVRLENMNSQLLQESKAREAEIGKQWMALQEAVVKLQGEKEEMLARLSDADLEAARLTQTLTDQLESFQIEKANFLADLAAKELTMSAQKEALDSEREKLKTGLAALEAEKVTLLSSSNERESEISKRNKILEDGIAKLTIDHKQLDLERENLLEEYRNKQLEVSMIRQCLVDNQAKLEADSLRLLHETSESKIEMDRQSRSLQEEKLKFEKEKTAILSSLKETELELVSQKRALQDEQTRIEADIASKLVAINNTELQVNRGMQAILEERNNIEKNKECLEAEKVRLLAAIKEKEIEAARQIQVLEGQLLALEVERAKIKADSDYTALKKEQNEKLSELISADKRALDLIKSRLLSQQGYLFSVIESSLEYLASSEQRNPSSQNLKDGLITAILGSRSLADNDREAASDFDGQLVAMRDEFLAFIRSVQAQANDAPPVETKPECVEREENNAVIEFKVPTVDKLIPQIKHLSSGKNSLNTAHNLEQPMSQGMTELPSDFQPLARVIQSHASVDLNEVPGVIKVRGGQLDRADGQMLDVVVPEEKILGNLKSIKRPSLEVCSDDLDELRIVDRGVNNLLTPTNSIKTTKKYDFGQNNKDSELKDSRQQSSFSEKAFANRSKKLSQIAAEIAEIEIRKSSNPSHIFRHVHDRIKDVSQTIDSQNAQYNTHNKPNVVAFGGTISLGLESRDNYAETDFGKREAVSSIRINNYFKSPKSAQNKFLVISDKKSAKANDIGEALKLDCFSIDSFARQHIKLRHQNLSKPHNFHSKLHAASKEELLALWRPINEKQSNAANINTLACKQAMFQRLQRKDKKMELTAKCLQRLVKSRSAMVFQSLHSNMLREIGKVVPRFSKPVRLMRVATLLNYLVKTRMASALASVVKNAAGRSLGTLDNRTNTLLAPPTNQEGLQLESELCKTIPEIDGNDDHDLSRSPLDSVLDAVEYRPGNPEARGIYLLKDNLTSSKQSATTRDLETKAIEFELKLVSRLRKFQKLQHLCKTVEKSFAALTFHEIVDDWRNF